MEQGLDIRYITGVIRRRLVIMLLTFAAGIGAALAVAVLLPPVFLSEARILVESQRIPPNLVQSTVTTLADERLQVIKQRITTRDVLLRLSRKFNMFPKDRDKLTPTEMVERMRKQISIERFELGKVRRRRATATTIGFTVGFEYRVPQVATRVS